MSATTQLTDCTASELLALYRSGDASPVEAAQAVLKRIERLNPLLTAYCHLAPEDTLASARASEARWRRRVEATLGGTFLLVRRRAYTACRAYALL